MFYSSILNNIEFCNYLLKYILIPVVFVKTPAWIWQISQIGWFFTRPKIFYTSVTCDTCDKFHVCIGLVILISFHKMQYSVLESSHQLIHESWTAHLWLHGSYPLGWDGHTSFPPHQFFWAWEVRNVWPQPTNIINIITIIQHQMHMGSQDDRLHWCWGSFSSTKSDIIRGCEQNI